jgi:hypothetical protein
VGRKGVWAPNILHVFVFLSSKSICRLHKLTLSAQAEVTLQLRVYFRFIVNIFSRSALAGKARENFLTGTRNPFWQSCLLAPRRNTEKRNEFIDYSSSGVSALLNFELGQFDHLLRNSVSKAY